MTSDNENCDRCGAKAGFETSPEGDPCSKCGRWFCPNCIDYQYMREHDLTDEFVCLECALDKNLRDLSRRFNKLSKNKKATDADFEPLYAEARALKTKADAIGCDIKLSFKNQFGGKIY